MNKKIAKFVVKALFASLILALTASPILVLAGGNSIHDPEKFGDWTVVGPNGGDVRVVTIDPRDKNKLYISTLDGQIHTSTDGGKSWKLLVNLNQPGLRLDQLFVDSRDSKVLYASGNRGNFPGAFFKSTDSGASWKESKELRGESFHSMFQSAKDPNTIVLGSFGGVWISKDSGDSWTRQILPIDPKNAVDSIAIDPRDINVMYAGTWWRAYKTTDGGKNWKLVTSGMIDDSDVFAINIDPRNADHVIASACSGIYESINAGEKWAKIQGIPSTSRRTRDIEQNPTVAGPIYAATTQGFWMSPGGSKGWMLTTSRDLEVNSIAISPDDPNRIFIGTNNSGVLVSTDGGRNFTPTNDNFTSRLTYSITPDVERTDRVYAATHNTMAGGGGYFYYSDNGGNSWQQAKGLDVNAIRPYSVIQDKTTPDNMFLGTNVGVYKSIDRGVSWTLVKAVKPPVTRRKKPAKPVAKAGVKRTPPVAAATPPAPKKVLALTEKINELTFTNDGKNGLLAGTDTGLYRTYDITKGWEKVAFGDGIDPKVYIVLAGEGEPNTLWVGSERLGILVSHDEGVTWARVNATPEGIPITSIAVDPKRPDYVYVGTTQALYISRDSGKSWKMRGNGLPLGSFTSILINPDNTDEVFVSSSLENDGGIYYSENAGQKWKRLDSKEMNIPSRRVWSMAFDAHDPNKIFAGSHSSGVYRIERRVETGKTDDQTRSRVVPSN
ncbi:MAG: YCF48-related protein [Acidobacteriota bacterium]